MGIMNILLIIVFCLTGAAVVLAIVNWFYLISISAKANELELEINKKAQEFDNFKKEKQSAPQNETIIDVADSPLPEVGEPVLTDEPIQIMRNVGGSFEEAEKRPFAHVKAKPLPQEFQDTPTHGFQKNIKTVITPKAMFQYDLPSENNTEPDVDVLATVSEQPLPYQTRNTFLPLYSESAKDADFGTLWKNISATLQSKDKTEINIDFTGINFLYDKELEYLFKIYQVVSSTGRHIHFMNCDLELITIIINKYPQLGLLIQKKDL